MSPSFDEVIPIRVRVPVAITQGTLALDLQPRLEPPPTATLPIGRQRRHSIEEWVRRFAQAAVEIVGGDRPVTQLLRWSSRDVYADLERRAQLVARAGRHQAGQGRVQPVRPKVLGVHLCFLDREVVEVSAHVRYGEHSRALAARFEERQQRWCCTALEFA